MTTLPPPEGGARAQGRPTEHELLTTLFDLGRQVTSVLDLDELLPQIPALISRLIDFEAFAVYLVDRKRQALRIAYSVGYPEDLARAARRRVGEGLVGTAVAEGQPIRVSDLSADPRYIGVVPGMQSSLVVPLRHKRQTIGALNILSRHRNQFTEMDVAIVRQFGAHVAVAIVNARLFERERSDAEAFETLAEIGREVASILDLEELLSRIAHLAKRVIEYRTFGILLLNERTHRLEARLAVHYGEGIKTHSFGPGEGLVGHAALHRETVLVPDVSVDPRYIKVVEDVRSELVIPLLVKDRCIGVFDLESPELDAFSKRDVEILTPLAAQAAVAIENARLYETIRANQARLESELRFARRVQTALLPTELPKRLRGVDVAARFAPARELGGDFYDFLMPEANRLVIALGDVSGKGVAAALYSAFAGELVRSRTFRRPRPGDRAGPGDILASVNTILHQRQLEEYYCTLCYAAFDLKRRALTLANSGLPYPIRCSGDDCSQIELPGVPLGSFAGSTYDELSYPLSKGDVIVFCSDGVSETMNDAGDEFGTDRLIAVVHEARHETAEGIVSAIMAAVEAFRGSASRYDDTTAVAIKILA